MRINFRFMRSLGPFALSVVLLVLQPQFAGAAAPGSQLPSAHAVDVSMADYRAHLVSLRAVVESCAKNRDVPHCDVALVGPDNRVPIVENGRQARRILRFDWLRYVLSGAAVRKPESKSKSSQPTTESTEGDEDGGLTPEDKLNFAVTRLNRDIEQVDDKGVHVPPHPEERAALRQVLAASQFSHLNRRTLRDELLERVESWLNRLFSGLGNKHAHSPWIGRVIFWGFILLVCIGLAWSLMQLERRWRLRLVPDSLAPAPGAASARDWQLWLDDARRCAASGQWREAIHFVYWSAISRLESRRLWPADRARTPREYLALVRADDPRRTGLARLTRSFERTWYGGRPAAEADYRSAEELASALIGTGSAGTKGGGA